MEKIEKSKSEPLISIEFRIDFDFTGGNDTTKDNEVSKLEEKNIEVTDQISIPESISENI